MPKYDVTAIRFGLSLNFEVYIPEGIAGYGERRWAVNWGKRVREAQDRVPQDKPREIVLGLMADLGLSSDPFLL